MIREVEYRVEVIRSGVAHTELIFDAATPPNLYMDLQGEIKCSLSGTFRRNDAVDYLRDELRPVMVLNGVEHPLGIFFPTTVQRAYGETGETVAVEAYDRSYRLQETVLAQRLHLDAGASYITVIRQLLTQAGIALAIVTPCADTLQTAREDWDAGTSYLSIVNQLLTEINYSAIWFDANGYARLEPYAPPDAARIRHRYSAADLRQAPVSLSGTAQIDLFDRPNVFLVRCSNPDLAQPMTAQAVNDNPQSALSTIRRGRRILKVCQVDNIASQQALQAYANRLCQQSMLATEQVRFETLCEPGHGVGDVIALEHPGMEGVYEETAWYLTLAAGSLMSHDARKVVLV
mgnify:FL=1